MPDKVKLPREVAEALKNIKSYGCNPDYFILWRASRPESKEDQIASWNVLYEFATKVGNNIFLLADALRYGYEVEPEPITVTITPEMQEKITQYYANLDPNTQEDAFDREFVLGERSGVRFTLEMLGITIPGIPSEG